MDLNVLLDQLVDDGRAGWHAASFGDQETIESGVVVEHMRVERRVEKLFARHVFERVRRVADELLGRLRAEKVHVYTGRLPGRTREGATDF